MKYLEFIKAINEKVCDTELEEFTRYRGHRLAVSTDGRFFVDEKKIDVETLDEARRFIDNQIFQKKIIQELYEETSHNKIAKIIKEHTEEKVTDTLIETYIGLASSKCFTIDPIVCEIREMNSYDTLIENRIDYVLEDGSVVVIQYETQEMLNNLLEGQQDIVNYMRQSKKNFVQVIKQIKESTWQS